MTLSPTAASGRPLRTVIHNVVHMFLKPTRNCEMVSQTLMGRTVEVLEEQEGWCRVQTDDAYRGWVESRWLGEASAEGLSLVAKPFANVRNEAGQLQVRLPILCGVRVALQGKQESAEIETPGGEVRGSVPAHSVTDALEFPPPPLIGAKSAEWACEFLGTPYLWGGSSSFGLDCSGLVQLCYRLCGVTLRRDADIQRDDPRFLPVAFEDLAPGDLVFFGKPDKITHVGMHYEGKSAQGGTFIHSAGGAGVIVTPWGDDRYSPSYVDARRLDIARAADPVERVEAENR